MNAVELLIAAAMLLGLIWWSLARSDEPAWLIVRWIITFMMVGGMWKIGYPLLTQGQMGVIAGILIIAACAIVIGITWAKSWTGIALSPLTDAFDGGNQEVEAAAIYSAAETKRKRGLFQEAITEIHKQLEKFPNDFNGLMLLAQIQGDHLQDLSAAQQTVNLIADVHRDTPSHASGALVAMADMYLKVGQVEEARKNLEQIIDSFPNTSFSQLAAQRIAHLQKTQQTIDERHRAIVLQSHYAKDVGLQKTSDVPTDRADDPAVLAAEYVAHLQQHPLDVETRQRLAALYAERFQRIELAQMEYEQLIAQPNQSPKQIAQHLNALADWQVKLGHGDAARETIKRIIEMFPKTALSDAAETRLARLGNELRGQQKSQATVKLGSYKKDLGLNRY